MTVHLKHDLESFLSNLSSLNLRKSMNLVGSSYKTHCLFLHLPLWDCLLCHDKCKNKGNHLHLEPTLWLNIALNMLPKHNSGCPINKHESPTLSKIDLTCVQLCHMHVHLYSDILCEILQEYHNHLEMTSNYSSPTRYGWKKHVGENKVNKIHYKHSTEFCWLCIFYRSD